MKTAEELLSEHNLVISPPDNKEKIIAVMKEYTAQWLALVAHGMTMPGLVNRQSVLNMIKELE